MKRILLIFGILLGVFQLKAQGEQLFKAKCNACHLLEKNSTGPNLKGVKQKWADAGEGDLIYDWVKNPAGLIATGKSQMALAIKDFNASEMTAQDLTKEEVDAVLDYVDNYTPPVEVIKTEGGEVEVTYRPNYKSNLDTFYFLLLMAFIQVIGILILSNSIVTLIKSDFFKKKLSENGGKILKVLIMLITFGLIGSGNQLFALSMTESAAGSEPTVWLQVENIDIYYLVIINVFLLGVILYLKNMFKNFLRMIKPEKVVVNEEKTFEKLSKVLTDAVPIEDEERIMLHHEYDGIRELDNNLPPWWVWGFVGTIIFAVVYLFNYHILGTGDLQIKAYEKDIKRSEREVKAYLSKMAMNVDENNATILTDASDISKGKSLFEVNCVTCHNPKGEGNIGPNLTDKTWIYGYDVKEVFKTIKLGTPNGMPEHSSKLNPIQIQQVASFVLQLQETKGKEAEGTIVEK